MTEDNPCGDILSNCCALKSSEPKIPPVIINNECGIRNTEGVGFRITGDKDNESQFGNWKHFVCVDCSFFWPLMSVVIRFGV